MAGERPWLAGVRGVGSERQQLVLSEEQNKMKPLVGGFHKVVMDTAESRKIPNDEEEVSHIEDLPHARHCWGLPHAVP